jgi:hypothetical protein
MSLRNLVIALASSSTCSAKAAKLSDCENWFGGIFMSRAWRGCGCWRSRCTDNIRDDAENSMG